MDITTLSKSELIELLYAVTEKAKKKGGKKGIQTPPALPLEDNSSKPLKGKHWSQWKSPRLAENQMKRRKELFEATEKAKKKSAQPPSGDAGGNKTEDSNRRKIYDESNASKQHPDFVPDFSRGQRPLLRMGQNMANKPPQLPSAGQKTPRVMPGSRVDINKQNKNAAANQKKATLNKRSDFHKMKVNEAKMKRRKELDSSSVTEKGRRGSHREGGGGPKLTGNEPRPTRVYTRAAINYPEGPGSKYSAPQGPDKKNRSMKRSWEWEAPMGKRRGKELQTEQAIDQYLSYESEMDDNRQLMFEVITEKAMPIPPRLTPRQENKKRQNESNDVKPGERWKPKDERDTVKFNKYGGWTETRNAKGAQLTEDRMKKETQDSNKRIQREGGFRARSTGMDHLGKQKIISDNYRAGSRQERPYSPENVGDKRRGAQAQKIQAATRMQVNVGKARQKRKLGFPAIVPTRRNKELFESTEKAMKRSIPIPPRPRQAAAQAAAAGRQSLAESNKRQAQAEQSRRDRVRQGVEKKSDGDRERLRVAGNKNRLTMFDDAHKKNPVQGFLSKIPGSVTYNPRKRFTEDDFPTSSRYHEPRLAEKHNPKASKVSTMSGAEVYRASKADTDTKRRRKEQQFDGSLVVGAESFFLQMVAATKPK